jgi:hypothetical protein
MERPVKMRPDFSAWPVERQLEPRGTRKKRILDQVIHLMKGR